MRRVVTDLLAVELARMRPGRPPLPAPWPADVQFVRDLGADSLELMGLGTALVEALHLQRGGIDEQLLARPSGADWIARARSALAACAQAGADGADVADVESPALTFRTSGSSGSPKRCTHTLAALEQEVAALAPLVPGRRRILRAVPSHHIYGFLFAVLLPLRLANVGATGSAEVVQVIDVRQAGPAALAGLARAGDLAARAARRVDVRPTPAAPAERQAGRLDHRRVPMTPPRRGA